MVTNQTANDAGVAGAFNDATKLQYINLSNKPPLYKIYPDLRSIPLPDVAGSSGPEMSTLQAIRGSEPNSEGGSTPTVQTLAELLYHAAAVIRRRNLRDGEVHYRGAASAGALYPTEVYVVCGDLDGLRAGVYHFNPLDCTLARLRNGDLRRWVGAASQDHAAYPATLGVHDGVLAKRLEISGKGLPILLLGPGYDCRQSHRSGERRVYSSGFEIWIRGPFAMRVLGD